MLKLSQREPVFIARRGKVVGVLSRYQDYQQQSAC